MKLFRATTTMAALWALLIFPVCGVAGESPYLYGIHDHSPDPSEYLSHITSATGAGGWITATVAVGADTNDVSGTDFSTFASAGHTVICRINYGYYPAGTIPLPAAYDAFAARCRNFVVHSPGCSIWLIGNEVNLSAEWPFDSVNRRFAYLSPQDYAICFRKVFSAIKAVRPNDKVLPQACAPWAGPYGAGVQNINGTNYPADGQPLTWVQYENQMLTAITNSGALDGIALHVGSRGYHNADIFSTNKFGGLNLYSSFFVYKDWVDYGIPPGLYALPLYVTECNGLYYWKGGGPPGEDPTQHYEPGWLQAIYSEINSYNQLAATTGKPIFRCFNMYRWCGFCDGWNLDGPSNGYKAQILGDLDAAAGQRFAWPTNLVATNLPASPTGLTATVGNGNVTLNWTTAAFATSYNLKRSTVNGGPYTTIASNISSTTFVNTSFTPNTTYYYVVSGLNTFGEGPNSAQVSARPTNGLPDVVVTALTWTTPGTLFAPTNIVFRATVKNQGSASTPAGTTLGIGFLVDGVQYSWSGGYSSALAPGTSVTLTADGGPGGVNFWTATPGSHNVTANVDDIDRFPEGNENNNTFDRTLAVYVRSYAINAGGAAVGAFAADAGWTGSTNIYTVTNSIDLSGAGNAAPQALYQSERWGAFSYVLNNLVPGSNYTARLHFAEVSPSVVAPGDRRFHVAIEGAPVLTNFDILGAAGAKFRAITRSFGAIPGNDGTVEIVFSPGASNQPKVSGLEVFPTVPVPPPRISSITATNGVVTLTWQSLAGKLYRVQYKASLDAPNWIDLAPDVVASGSTLSQTNAPGIGPRFYRVLVVE